MLWILLAASWLAAASWLISEATTANPFPASPARAASMDAFNASRFVWLAIFKMSFVRLSTWLTLLLSSIAWLSTETMSFTFAPVVSIFSRAACSIASACSFISLVYWLISIVFSAIDLTSPATDSVFSLIREALSEISCIVAESSSVSADRSDTLPLEVCTLSRTSFTTPSRSLELLLIIRKISCSFAIKALMPPPTDATSLLLVMVTLRVRSPCRLSISEIISFISLFVFASG